MKNGNTPAASREGDTLGYARVSTTDQDLASQQDRLEKAGAIRIFPTSSRAGNSIGQDSRS